MKRLALQKEQLDKLRNMTLEQILSFKLGSIVAQLESDSAQNQHPTPEYQSRLTMDRRHRC